MQAKRNRRKAERRWRASGLPSDLVVFKAKRNLTLHLMNEARRTYYTQFIDDNSSDQSKLFRASKSLLNLQPSHLTMTLCLWRMKLGNSLFGR